MTETPTGSGGNWFGSMLAATGATLLALVFSATSFAAMSWALVTFIGLPDFVMWGLLALSTVPVLWATVWTAGRAWHVEQRLTRGLDVDQPVFKLAYYLRKP
jgi:hypothetical protein